MKERRRNSPSRILACMLCIIMLISVLTGCQVPEDPTQGSSFPTTLPGPTDEPTEPTSPPPTETDPTEPAPTEPAPTEPAPTGPAPTEPAPTEPAPTEPAPTQPAPTEPAPTDPAPPAEEIPEWLLFSWSTVSRSDKPATSELPAISYLYSNELFFGSDGTGYQVYREWSNYDEYGLAAEWIRANKEDIQNTFTYIVSDNRVYITFTEDDSTVIFTVQQEEDRSHTLIDENSTIYLHDSVGNFLQRVCYLFGIDYGLPLLENTIPVSWLTGIWDHMEREDYSYGVCVLRSQYFNFNSSGTGDFYYDREWSNYNKYGTMTSEWNYLTEQSTSRRFTYSVRGDKLILFYKTGETEVYTAQLKGSDYLLLTNTQTGETLQYAKAYSNYSLKKMCDLLGIDYNLPHSVYDLSSKTWQTVWRENTNSGVGIIFHVSIQFKDDGTADYVRKVYQSGSSWNEVPERCMSGSFRYERNRYYLTISNIVGDVDLYEGNYTLYQNEDGYIYFCAPQGEPEHEYEKLYSVEEGTSLEQLCRLCNADYSLPPMKEPEGTPTANQLAGTWMAIERENWQGGVYALRYYTYTFRADGTGEELRGCYSNLDNNDYKYLDHWIERTDERWSSTFTYTYSNGILTMYDFSYTVTLSEDGILCLTDMYQSQTRFVNTQSDPSLYEVCKKLGVDSSVPLRDTALQGTYTHIEPTTTSDGTASLTATDYCFAPDGTGSKTIREYNPAEHKWESETSSFSYELLDMLYITYDNGDRAYYDVFLLEEGIISISDMWDQYVRFVDNDLAPTLEEQCALLGVKNPIPAA